MNDVQGGSKHTDVDGSLEIVFCHESVFVDEVIVVVIGIEIVRKVDKANTSRDDRLDFECLYGRRRSSSNSQLLLLAAQLERDYAFVGAIVGLVETSVGGNQSCQNGLLCQRSILSQLCATLRLQPSLWSE